LAYRDRRDLRESKVRLEHRALLGHKEFRGQRALKGLRVHKEFRERRAYKGLVPSTRGHKDHKGRKEYRDRPVPREVPVLKVLKARLAPKAFRVCKAQPAVDSVGCRVLLCMVFRVPLRLWLKALPYRFKVFR